MSKTVKYSSIGDCIIKTFKDGGLLAFYKGFSSNFMRIASYNIVCFIVLE